MSAIALAPPPANGEVLFTHLRDDRAVLGVVLGEPPANPCDEWDALSTALFLGLPVVAWSRDDHEAPEAVAQLLAAGDLATLPARLHKFRKDADAPDADPWHRVAVLYDDPTRPPPDVYPLANPEAL